MPKSRKPVPSNLREPLCITDMVAISYAQSTLNVFVAIQYNLSNTRDTGNCRNPASIFPGFRAIFYNQSTSNRQHEGIQSLCRNEDRFLEWVLLLYSYKSSLERVTQTRSILPPSGGFSFEIFTSASVISGYCSCTAIRMRFATCSSRCDC